MENVITLEELARKALSVLEAQQDYFRTPKDKYVEKADKLTASKALEQDLRVTCKVILKEAAEKQQTKLF
jgi:hypothetical protein